MNNNLFITSIISTLNIWLYRVMPPIYAFYIIISLLRKYNILNKILTIFKPLNKILKFQSITSFYLLLTSIFTGNPTAAKLIYNEYKNNNISKKDYNALIYCSNFVSPLFILSLFTNNIKYSIILLISHILSSFIICIFINLKNNNISIDITNTNTTQIYISDIFYNATEVSLSIASIMVFTNIITTSLSQFGINTMYLIPIELSTGIFSLITSNLNFENIIILISSLLSFNGFCIHLQIFNQIKDINYKTFLMIRIMLAIVSCLITILLL